MAAHSFSDLAAHVGHSIACVTYGGDGVTWNVSLECEDCHVVLLDFDADESEDPPEVRFVVEYDPYPWEALDYLDQWDDPKDYERDGPFWATVDGERHELTHEEYMQSYGDRNNYTVYVVEKQRCCACCDQWETVDALSGCAEYFGPYAERYPDGSWGLEAGTYTYDKLPAWVREQFTPEPTSDL